MQALVVTSPDVAPQLADFPEPVPGPGEQVVSVVAAGIHPIVRALAAGSHYGSTQDYPQVPGVDAVARLEDGTTAYTGFARSPYGTLSERTVVPRGWSIPLPERADPVTVAGTVNPAMAAWMALQLRGELASGARVLVLGATGTSGRVAVQLARDLGASQVVAAGRNSVALRELADEGARVVDVSTDEATDDGHRHDALVERFREALPQPPDLVVDFLWGPVTEAAMAAVMRTGLEHTATRVRWVQVGDRAGDAIRLPAALLRSSGVELVGSGAGSVDPSVIAAQIPAMLERIAVGTVRVPVRAVPLADAEHAWATSDTPGTRLVVTP